jgi:hypothetical protein
MGLIVEPEGRDGSSYCLTPSHPITPARGGSVNLVVLNAGS